MNRYLKYSLLTIVILAIGFAIYYFATKLDNHSGHEQQAAIYTCPMHPEVISDKPGKCPQCGMDLELKSEKSGQDDTKKDTHNHESHKGCKGH